MTGIDPKGLEDHLIRFAEKIGPLFVEDIREFFSSLPDTSGVEPQAPDVEPVAWRTGHVSFGDVRILTDIAETAQRWEREKRGVEPLFSASALTALRIRAETAEAENAVLRTALEQAKEWLEGWGSATSQLAVIEAALQPQEKTP